MRVTTQQLSVRREYVERMQSMNGEAQALKAQLAQTEAGLQAAARRGTDEQNHASTVRAHSQRLEEALALAERDKVLQEQQLENTAADARRLAADRDLATEEIAQSAANHDKMIWDRSVQSQQIRIADAARKRSEHHAAELTEQHARLVVEHKAEFRQDEHQMQMFRAEINTMRSEAHIELDRRSELAQSRY